MAAAFALALALALTLTFFGFALLCFECWVVQRVCPKSALAMLRVWYCMFLCVLLWFLCMFYVFLRIFARLCKVSYGFTRF